MSYKWLQLLCLKLSKILFAHLCECSPATEQEIKNKTESIIYLTD